MLLVRKLNLDRWLGPKPDGYEPTETPIEVLSKEKLVANELSFWAAVDASDSELNAVATAVAAAPRADELSALDLVWLEEAAVVAAGISLRKSRGETRIPDLADRHRDAFALDVSRFSRLAGLLADGVNARHTRRLVRDEVAELLADAVDGGRLAPGVSLGKRITEVLDDVRRRRSGP